MAKKSSQGPRAKRSSMNDPQAFTKGSVRLEMNEPRKDGGPENAGAWKYQGESVSRTWKPDV